VAAGGDDSRAEPVRMDRLGSRLVDCGLQSPAGDGQMLAAGNSRPASTASSSRFGVIQSTRAAGVRAAGGCGGIEQFPARSRSQHGIEDHGYRVVIVMCLTKFFQIIADSIYVIHVRYHPNFDACGG